MTPAALRLRSISELLSERFSVPTYQRGYRWTKRQVEDLLDDLATFQRCERNPENYYCLQPVVVRKRTTGEWELVDGQQRLTTIALVIRVLADFAAILKVGCYEIAYDSRRGSADFLREPAATLAGDFVDFNYMFAAYEAIQKWFDSREGGMRLDLLRCLTGTDGSTANVRVIWYELKTEQPAIEAFVRLNVGRIPLTSAELIRALLLRSDGHKCDGSDAFQLAHEWDVMERRLQHDDYWYFLQSDGRPSPNTTASRPV